MTHRTVPAVALSERVCLSVGDAAALAGLSVSFLYILMERGALRSVKVHGRRLIPRPALDELLASHDQSATTRLHSHSHHVKPEERTV
jgi:excisionase family DNA binding protein